MPLIEVSLPRRPKKSDHYRPQMEILEQRECLAVAAPTLSLTAPAPTQVKLTWTNVANEAGYRIYRWVGTQSQLVAQVNRDVTTYTVAGLAPNSTQWFQVEAFDLSSKAASQWASIVTPRETITAPTNVKLTNPTLTQMTVNWSFVTGATGYRVFGWDGTKAVQLAQVANTVNAFTVQNLAPGTNYYFYVQAFNATNSASSAWVSGSTMAVGLTAPSVQAQVVSSSVINLSWTDQASESGYRVYRNDGSQTVLVATLGANITGYQATGLAPGKAYSFYVQAFTPTSTANSAWVEATTTGGPLQPVTNLVALATGPSTVKLTWTEPARAIGYRVYVWGGTYWVPYVQVARGTTTVTVNNLYSNRTHWFLIEAFTENFAELAYSNRVSVFL